MAIEIVDLPIEHGGSFHGFLYVYQRVNPSEKWSWKKHIIFMLMIGLNMIKHCLSSFILIMLFGMCGPLVLQSVTFCVQKMGEVLRNPSGHTHDALQQGTGGTQVSSAEMSPTDEGRKAGCEHWLYDSMLKIVVSKTIILSWSMVCSSLGILLQAAGCRPNEPETEEDWRKTAVMMANAARVISWRARGLVDRGPEVMADCQLNMVGHLFVKRRPIVMYQKMVNAITVFP